MKNKNILGSFIFFSFFATQLLASDMYTPLTGHDSSLAEAQSGCCGITIKDSKTHEKNCFSFSALSCLGGVETAALSFGAAYSSSKIVCIGLSAAAGCTGCMTCAAVALATQGCTLALVARRQEEFLQHKPKPVNAQSQQIMTDFPVIEKLMLK